MIPKVIHYCWFGKGKKPFLIRKCLESWQKIMPDYEIKEWNEDNFDIGARQFTREAYAERKWAFIADVCRFYACYTEGGIYLDTDVEVFRRFDEFLKNSFFTGTEIQHHSTSTTINVDASVFGCERGHWFAKECLDFYDDKPLHLPNGAFSGGVVQVVASRALKPYGYQEIDKFQQVNDVTIYPTSHFANVTTVKDKKTLYSLHHYDGSWLDESRRGWLFRFCRKHDLMHFYRWIEQLMK